MLIQTYLFHLSALQLVIELALMGDPTLEKSLKSFKDVLTL